MNSPSRAVAPLPPRTDAAGAAGFVRSCGGVALLAIGAVSVYAALELRPLHNDAVYYLQGMLEYETFKLSAPARKTVEWIRQTPTLFAVRLGVTDLHTLALILSFSFALIPLAIAALTWLVLPQDKKWYFVFPLLHFCAGTLAGIASAAPEGATAAAVFWFLFYFLLFRANGTRAIDAAIVLSIPFVVLHEAMLFLGPVLALAAILRARHTSARADRIALALLAVWFAIVAAVQIDFIANPRHAGHGAGYVRDLLSGSWLLAGAEGFNLSAAFGVAGLGLLGVLALLEIYAGARWRRAGWLLAIGLSGIAVIAAASFAATDRIHDMGLQVRARNHALLLSLPLALAALLAFVRPAIVRFAVVRQAATLCAAMAIAGAVWQAQGVARWSQAVADFRMLLDTNRGFVEWETAVGSLPPARQRAVREVIYGWIVSPMSIILAPGGKVSTIVGVAKPTDFRPFDPLDPASLPRSRFWDLKPYLATLPGRAPAPDRR